MSICTLGRAHLTQGEAAVVRRRVVPAEALRVRGKLPARQAALVGKQRIHKRPHRLGHAIGEILLHGPREAEDQIRVARYPGAVELRPAADAARPLEELGAERELLRLADDTAFLRRPPRSYAGISTLCENPRC